MFLAARDITKVPLFAVGRPHVSWDIRLSAQSSFTASNRAYSLFFATTLDEGIRNSIEHMAYVAAHYHGCKACGMACSGSTIVSVLSKRS
jgi:hypothetical protein